MNVFNTMFPWIGAIGAIVLLGLLFMTNVLRSDLSVSRWRDLTWLSWAAAAVYLVHNVEEYGIDLHGETYAFPKFFCGMFGFSSTYPTCPVPAAVFTAVNVPMFWFAAPVAALMSKRHPLVGLTIYSVISINLLTHIGEGLVSGTNYNPGWLTAVILFLPLTLWMVYALFWTGPMSYRALAFMIGWGIAVHVILILGMLPLIKGLVHNPVPAVIVQIVNAALLIVVPWLVERWMGDGVFNRPMRAVK